MNKRQAIPYSLLLVAFLIWLYLKPQEEPIAIAEHHPSYIVYNIINTHFDETGAISNKIFAAKTTNFSDKETTFFEQPKGIRVTSNNR